MVELEENEIDEQEEENEEETIGRSTNNQIDP